MTRAARPWDVYKIFTEQTNPPKLKYLIVTHVPDGGNYCYGIFINSERTAFQQQEHLDSCFIRVPVRDHDFLRWDSFAACGDVYTFQNHLLTDQTYQGQIHPATAQTIIDGALACPILKGGHKRNMAALTPP